MAAASDNVYDILVWIKKVIDSTTTIEQFQNADQLIELFDKKYDNWTLYKDLSMHAINHLDKLK
jgi:hypothetical protein